MNDFYNINAKQYFRDTVSLDPTHFLAPLLVHLPPGSAVLDIGCGSGRDLLWLKERGFNPVGLERAENLAALARTHSGCPVLEGDFQTYDFSRHHVDAVVSIGSLVHLPSEKCCTVLASLLSCLASGGLILLTMKEGDGISLCKDGRCFTLWRADHLLEIFRKLHLEVLDFSRQLSSLRQEDTWLGYLLKYPGPCPVE